MENKIHPNKSLIERIRDSKIEGPFKVEIKISDTLNFYGLSFLTPLFKRWREDSGLKEGKILQTPQEVIDYLENHYIGKNESWFKDGYEEGYPNKIVSEKKRLGDQILKIASLPHRDSVAARKNLPMDYFWLRIKPSAL